MYSTKDKSLVIFEEDDKIERKSFYRDFSKPAKNESKVILSGDLEEYTCYACHSISIIAFNDIHCPICTSPIYDEQGFHGWIG